MTDRTVTLWLQAADPDAGARSARADSDDHPLVSTLVCSLLADIEVQRMTFLAGFEAPFRGMWVGVEATSPNQLPDLRRALADFDAAVGWGMTAVPGPPVLPGPTASLVGPEPPEALGQGEVAPASWVGHLCDLEGRLAPPVLRWTVDASRGCRPLLGELMPRLERTPLPFWRRRRGFLGLQPGPGVRPAEALRAFCDEAAALRVALQLHWDPMPTAGVLAALGAGFAEPGEPSLQLSCGSPPLWRAMTTRALEQLFAALGPESERFHFPD